MQRLTDAALKAAVKRPPTKQRDIPDGSVPGLFMRLGTGGAANWSLLLRVTGEGGTTATGRRLVGRKHRINLGTYPDLTIEGARGKANELLSQAKRGINPRFALKQAATAGGLTVRALSEDFMKNHVLSRDIDSAPKYRSAFDTHINPNIGTLPAETLDREHARGLMDAARVKRKRPKGGRGGELGGIEAARTVMGVIRHMFSWAIEEGKLNRKDNPCSKITKNLPEKKKGEVVLTLDEARVVYQAGIDCGYPFGDHLRLMLLNALRLDNWASAVEEWVDLKEGLSVIPADEFKSDHVHIVPLVPQAVEIVHSFPARTTGPYLLSSTGGSTPIQGISKFYRTRLANQIIANTGKRFHKRLTTQTIRRTVATRVAEVLGEQGEKVVKRVLGHADGGVTAIYNRYAYVKEMRRVLELWANDLTA